MTAIDCYLRELAHALGLRTPHTRRVLLEVEDHLREAAREVGESEAVARFGDARIVAASFAAEAVRRLTRWTALAVGAAVVGTTAAYVAVENGAPPAPWPSPDAAPSYLEWKLWIAQRLVVVGFLAGGAALATAWLRPERVAATLAAAGLATASLAAAGVLASIEAFQRAAIYRDREFADVPPDLAIAGVVLVQLLPVLAALALGARALAWLRVSRA